MENAVKTGVKPSIISMRSHNQISQPKSKRRSAAVSQSLRQTETTLEASTLRIMKELQNLETSRCRQKFEGEEQLFPAEQLHKGLYARKQILEQSTLWDIPRRHKLTKPAQKPPEEQPKLKAISLDLRPLQDAQPPSQRQTSTSINMRLEPQGGRSC